MALLQVLLVGHGEHRIGIGIKCFRHVRPMVEVGAAWLQRSPCSGYRPRLRQKVPSSVAYCFAGLRLETCALQHHCELAGSAPGFWGLLWCRNQFPLLPPGLPPGVQGGHVDAQLIEHLSHALTPRRTHPPAYISLDCLAVKTHCSAPSSHLVGGISWVGEASSFQAEGFPCGFYSNCDGAGV